MSLKLKTATLILTLMLPSFLYSQSNVNLGTVIVNADAYQYQTGDVSPEETSSFSSIIKKESFEAKSNSISDVVEKESGVQVRQSGGLGSFSSLSLRGASSNQVMVFMDGIPLNDGSGGGVDLSTIPLSDVDSIEIYKGITPINFGRSSIGGAVNIKTTRSQKDIKGSITTEYGSFNTFRISPFVSHKPGKFDYVISGDYQSSKNNFVFLNNNGTKWNSLDDKWETRNNDQFSQSNVLFTAGYDLTKDTRFELSNQYFSKGQNLPSWNNSPSANTHLNTIRDLTSIKATINDLGAAHINSASRIDNSYKKETYDDRGNNVGLSAQYNEYLTTSYGYNQFFELPTKYNIIDAVFDVHKENYTTKDLLNTGTVAPSSRNYYSTSAEDKILLFNGDLIVNPALTFEYYDNNFDSSSAPRSESHGYLNPKLGLQYTVLTWLTIKTNIAKYIREPAFFELFGDRGLFVGNSDLKSERGINFDIGPELSYAPYDRFYLNRISFGITYFRSNVTDVISYVYNARGVGQAVNISNSTTNGIEASLKIALIKHAALTTNYTWQSAIEKNIIQAFNNKKLPGKFENSASIKLEATNYYLKPYYEFLYANGLYYDSANLLPAPTKKEHNLGVTFLMEKFTITAEVKNIGNDHYEDFNGFPTPGRSYWLTANYSI